MIVILCVDEKNGQLFNHRRQSRDRVVIQDILKTCEGKTLYMAAYSYELFKESENLQDVVVSPSFLTLAGKQAYCFVEQDSLLPYSNQIQQLILYRWGRNYPADHYLEIELSDWHQVSQLTLKGYSHEKITKEIYTK